MSLFAKSHGPPPVALKGRERERERDRQTDRQTERRRKRRRERVSPSIMSSFMQDTRDPEEELGLLELLGEG